MTRPPVLFYVFIHGRRFPVEAKSRGAACRRAIRHAIAIGDLKKQPRTTLDGGFEGVEVTLGGRGVAGGVRRSLVNRLVRGLR